MNPRIIAEVNELKNRMKENLSKARVNGPGPGTLFIDQKDVTTLEGVLYLLDFAQSIAENR